MWVYNMQLTASLEGISVSVGTDQGFENKCLVIIIVRAMRLPVHDVVAHDVFQVRYDGGETTIKIQTERFRVGTDLREADGLNRWSLFGGLRHHGLHQQSPSTLILHAGRDCDRSNSCHKLVTDIDHVAPHHPPTLPLLEARH